LVGWTKAKRSAAARKAARTRKRNARNKGVTPTAEKKEKSHHVVMVEAGYKSWLTRRRNFISKKLFRKVYKDLSSKRERDNVDTRLKEEYELEYERQGEAIIEEGLPDKISPPDKVMITEQLAVLATQIKINQYLKKTKSGKKLRPWQFVEFKGGAGRESAGIVDLLAMRKNFDKKGNKKLGMKEGDSLEIIQIQVKGGTSGNPSKEDIKRMKKVSEHYHFSETLLSRWTTNTVNFYRLGNDSSLKEVSPRTIFS